MEAAKAFALGKLLKMAAIAIESLEYIDHPLRYSIFRRRPHRLGNAAPAPPGGAGFILPRAPDCSLCS
jgi:hypothetical protein